MIIQESINIKVAHVTKKYWKNLGYNAIPNKPLKVAVKDLPEKSNYVVICKCDQCEKIYEIRYSRNTNICGLCLKREHVKKLPKHQPIHILKNPEEFISLVKDKGLGKQELAKHYNVNFPVINRWLKEIELELQPYHGLIKNTRKKQIINELKKKDGRSLAQIARDLSIPKSWINNIIQFSKEPLEYKSQFDYWEEEYKIVENNLEFWTKENNNKDLKTIAIENEISYEHLKKAFKNNNITVKIHAKNKSKGEIQVRDYIRSLGVECYSKKWENKYEIDCYCPEYNFGVEYCGEYWHRWDPNNQTGVPNKKYHQEKTLYFHKKGIQLLTIFEHEWKAKQEIIQSMINCRLKKAGRIFARKCQIVELNSAIAKRWHDTHHLSGGIYSKINLGLKHNNNIVAVLSFSKPRFGNKEDFEITRFSCELNTVVVGGFSKLFKHFNPNSCVTFTDLRVGFGNVYEKSGFQFIKHTLPNYWYYNKKKDKIYSRIAFQKHKLKSMGFYDENKTEQEIMREEGFYQIYDCGNAKFTFQSQLILNLQNH